MHGDARRHGTSVAGGSEHDLGDGAMGDRRGQRERDVLFDARPAIDLAEVTAGCSIFPWNAREDGGPPGLTLEGPRASFPLGFHHTARIVDHRLALAGDSAHGIHPIAGQGLNLGLRDVGALVEVLADGARLGLEPGDAQGLARYERWRGLDSFMVAAATDGLTRLFGVPGRAARTVRRLGLGAVQRLGPLKGRFMAEARGETGTLPRLLQGLAV